MKIRFILIAAGLVLTGAAGVYLSRVAAPVASVVSAPEPAPGKAEAIVQVAEDARRMETAAAYAELEASRKALQKQLSDLKSVLWGRELPAEQARSISREMMSAQYRLRDAPLLGAFSDAAGVRAEMDRVDAARVQLREISRTVGEPKSP